MSQTAQRHRERMRAQERIVAVPARACDPAQVLAFAALVVALATALTLSTATSAPGITRDEVLKRAQRRVDAPVPYSQRATYAGYRTDCSGYVSMAWATGTSWSTRSFHTVTHGIPVSDLKPGDALLKKGYHIRLFYGWADEEQTRYVAYESAYGTVAGVRIHSIEKDLAFGYKPVRYNRISNSPKPRNVLKNGSFNTWSRSWSGQPDQAVWWQVEGPPWEPPVKRNTSAYRTARTSLELINPGDDPGTHTAVTQSAAVVAGADYRVTAWAKTVSDPAGVELRLTYLDAVGTSLAETSITGDQAALDATGFRKLSVLTSAPPEAVRALVAVRLAGGGSTDESGTVIPGTSVILDDISLARPQVKVGIKASRSTARNGKKVVLSGAVSPAAAVSAPATVYVKKPGAKNWTILRTRQVVASDGGTGWNTSFTFKRTMPRGTYRFKTSVPAVPGYLGHTSGSVSVTLK